MGRSPFRRDAAGSVVVRLAAEELTVLREVVDVLRARLREPETDDTSIARLFPRAYEDPTEDRAEREWQALAGPELLRGRLDALDRVGEGLEEVGAGDEPGGHPLVLDDDGVAAWLGVLNDARLVLGTVVGVSRESEVPVYDDDDPRWGAAAAYEWLTDLQSELVELLLDGPAPA